jgi:hypothetical protein
MQQDPSSSSLKIHASKANRGQKTEMGSILHKVSRILAELTPLDGPPVAFQVFHPGQVHGRGGKLFQAAGGKADQAGPFEEIVDSQGRRKSGRAPCGQDMVGAGHIVADGFWGYMSEENGSGIFDFGEKVPWVPYRQLQVFGG